MKLIRVLILTIFFSSKLFGQNIDSIQIKFANKVCNCIGEVKEYNELKTKIDKCYIDTFNFIFNGATQEEIKFYTVAGNLQKVGEKLEFYLKSICPNVTKIIEEYVKPKKIEGSYPSNLNEAKLENKISSLNGKTIAFDGEIIKINNTNPEKTFLKIKLKNGILIWVGDMTNSELNIIGNSRRFLGYFIIIEKDDKEQTELGYYVLSFASYDKLNDKLTMYPGSERQIYEWANGNVPKSQK